MIGVLSIPMAVVAFGIALVLQGSATEEICRTANQIRRMTNTPEWAMEVYNRCARRQRIATYFFVATVVILATGIVAHYFGW